MHITDAIADMLTRIRNANSAKHDTVDVPASNMKKAIAQILLDEGFIKSFQIVEDGKQGIIHITLKYGPNKSQVISGLSRVSKPGLRIYADTENMPKVMKGLGIAIVSTSKGVMTDKQARKSMLAAKYWPIFGKQGGALKCLELVENPSRFPPVLTLRSTALP